MADTKLIVACAQLQITEQELAQVISTILTMAGTPHTVMKGTATFDGKDATDHYWVEVNGQVVDFRLREALSNNNAPDGAFVLADSGVAYAGVEEAQTILDATQLATQLAKC